MKNIFTFIEAKILPGLLVMFVALTFEARVEATSGFTNSVVAKTGDLGITEIGREVSINRNGKVAFLAKVPRANSPGLFTDNIFVYGGLAAPYILRNISPGIDGSFNNSFMPGVLINDGDRVLVRRRLEDSSPLGTIVSTYLDGWYANSVNSFDRWVIGVPLAGDFDGIYSYPGLNNSNGIVLMALDNGSTFLATDTTAGAFQIGLTGELRRPMIADNNTFVMRSGATPYTIQLREPAFALIRNIAGTANGFSGSNLGFSPAISDDGNIVAFYGEVLPASFPDTQGLNPGVGIFVAIRNGSNWVYKRMAGVRNNGYLDPGETYVDLDGNGQFTPPTEVDESNISSFFPDEKIGVSNSGTLIYKTSDRFGIKSLQTNKINLPNPSVSATAPTAVATQGETPQGAPSPIQDLTIYDPVSQATSGAIEFAFWANLQNNTQAVVHATGCAGRPSGFSKPDGGLAACVPPVVTFEPTITNLVVPQIDDNPDLSSGTGGTMGGGKRIFPDRPSHNDLRNFKRIRVKVQNETPNHPVFFRAFDIDDPSASSLPVDMTPDGSGSVGGDNRDTRIPQGQFSSVFGSGSCVTSIANSICSQTDSNGEAVVEFEVGLAPGDNYRIGVSETEYDLSDASISANDPDLNLNSSDFALDGRVALSPKLFVWRRLNVEVDSMGLVQDNLESVLILSPFLVPSTRTSSITVAGSLDPGRFQNGKIFIDGIQFGVSDNTRGLATSTITLQSEFTGLPSFVFHQLYDDDNLRGDSLGDNGFPLPPINLSNGMAESYDRNLNRYADAYIFPTRRATGLFESNNQTFLLNVENNVSDLTTVQNGCGACSSENEEFWVAYLQGVYQGAKTNDGDPAREGTVVGASFGRIPAGTVVTTDSPNPNIVPFGREGSYLAHETLRDDTMTTGSSTLKTSVHEVGHQMGLCGDTDSNGNPVLGSSCFQGPGQRFFGVMSAGNVMSTGPDTFFVADHVSILRKRTQSPGIAPLPNTPGAGGANLGDGTWQSQPIVEGKEEDFPAERAKEKPALNFSPATEGVLDPTFGMLGKVTTDINRRANFGYSLAIQPNDGKIIAIGDASNGSNTDFALVRYMPNGVFDGDFGSGGTVIAPIGNGNDSANAAALQPSDQKIVVAGSVDTPAGLDFALVRFNTDGSFDSSFGLGGKVVTDFFGKRDAANAVAIQSNGKILVAGTASNGSGDNAALARYNNDGSIDSSFGSNGKVVTEFSRDNASITDIEIQSDGKIVVAGAVRSGGGNFLVARYNGNGSLDTKFGQAGSVITDFDNSDDVGIRLAIQTDGKLILAGYTGGFPDVDFALIRYDPNGSLDNTFGNAGKVITTITNSADVISDLSVLHDGKIVVGGQTMNANDADFALAKYLPSGAIDSSFGSNGIITTQIGPGNDYITALKLQADNKLVVTGGSFNGVDNDFSVARYLAPDANTPVAVGGRVTTPTGLGLRNAVVALTDSLGVRRTATTSSFGVYSFGNVRAGETYTIGVSSKRYRFSSRILLVNDNLTNVDFVGLE